MLFACPLAQAQAQAQVGKKSKQASALLLSLDRQGTRHTIPALFFRGILRLSPSLLPVPKDIVPPHYNFPGEMVIRHGRILCAWQKRSLAIWTTRSTTGYRTDSHAGEDAVLHSPPTNIAMAPGTLMYYVKITITICPVQARRYERVEPQFRQ